MPWVAKGNGADGPCLAIDFPLDALSILAYLTLGFETTPGHRRLGLMIFS
jgi:hypothetical protein